MKFSHLFLLSIICLSLFSCGGSQTKELSEKSTKISASSTKSGKLIENIQTPKYTYLKLKNGDKEQWFAIGKMEVENGKNYFYSNEVEMKDFYSRKLDRTFKSIYFIDALNDTPEKENDSTITDIKEIKGHSENIKKEALKIKPAKGGITIGELFKNSKNYAGKKVKIKGKVVKFNANIMDKNWVHIQDGTSNEGNFDLTITTSETVNIDETVTFEGKISLNKDFGYGYSFVVIMEEAVNYK